MKQEREKGKTPGHSVDVGRSVTERDEDLYLMEPPLKSKRSFWTELRLERQKRKTLENSGREER